MRQYTSNGRINGYAGPLDLNYFHSTTAHWNKYTNPNGGIAPQPMPAPKLMQQPLKPRSGSYSVTVRSGGTINGIAAHTGLWPVTAWSVPGGDINRIWPGQTVIYGKLHAGHKRRMDARIHVVKCGWTLSSIFGTVPGSTLPIPETNQIEEYNLMDISAATTLAAGITALITPTLIQAFKKHIPADYVGVTNLGVSILLGGIAIATINGFHMDGASSSPVPSASRRPSTRSSTRCSMANSTRTPNKGSTST